MESQELFFKVHGNWLSNHIRTLVIEGDMNMAWRTFSRGITADVGAGEKVDMKPIFLDLLKGFKTFEGVNDLELVDCSKDNVIPRALQMLVSELMENKAYNKFLDEKVNSPEGRYKLMEDDEGPMYSFDELAKIRFSNIDKQELLQKRLDDFKFLVGVTPDELKEAILKRHTSDSVTSACGWITEKGHFVPVHFTGHDSFIETFKDEVEENLGVEHFEKRWVRVTTGFAGSGISAFGFPMTAKQKITLQKWFVKHNRLSHDGDEIDIFGYGKAVNDNGQIKFIQYKNYR